jgi:epoxyqueuosine reductase
MPGFSEDAQERLARALKLKAGQLGFLACGISEATTLDQEARDLELWLTQGLHGTMGWMENHFDKRVDPRLLVPGARSVVSVLDNYYQPGEAPDSAGIGRISRYAWGDDYHAVMKERLAELFAWLDTAAGGVSGRVFVDSAPVMDKAWARRSGLGWIGKHTNLISPSAGSYFFVGEMIVDVPLAADGAMADHCGSCTRCIDACPTQAILGPRELDASRCISYLTIEHRAEALPEETAGPIGNWIYGCDVCQDVCPWNKFRQPSSQARYAPRDGLSDTPIREWEELDIEQFRLLFRGSPVKRAKYTGFMRNVRNAAENLAASQDRLP